MPKDNRSFFERLTGSVSLEEAPEPDEPEIHTASALAIDEDTAEGTRTDETAEWVQEVSDDDGQLTVDVYQTPSHIIIQAPMAGVKPDDVDVAITQDMITIKGSRANKREAHDGDYYYQELYWGSFSRSIILPEEIDADNAKASMKNGILTLHLPKLAKSRTKKIKISS